MRIVAGTLAFCMSLSGCVLSISEIIPSEGAQFDERLLGDWHEVDGSDRVTIARDSQNYLIDHFDEDGVTHLRGRLGRIGNHFVLDVTPTTEFSEEEQAMFVPTHLLIAIEFRGETVSVATLEPDTLRQRLAAGVTDLSHIVRENDILLTDSTAVLRAGLQTYLTQPGIWQQPATWRRVPR